MQSSWIFTAVDHAALVANRTEWAAFEADFITCRKPKESPLGLRVYVCVSLFLCVCVWVLWACVSVCVSVSVCVYVSVCVVCVCPLRVSVVCLRSARTLPALPGRAGPSRMDCPPTRWP